MAQTLFQKVWEQHRVRELANGQVQLFIGLHLTHEVTSPQSFGMLREIGLPVAFPGRTFATVDHIVPTDTRLRPYRDSLAEDMVVALETDCRRYGIRLFDDATQHQGIIHVIGPELGLTQPGMTICCGDSHTATHGAFGALAFGIGATQGRDVFATQTLSLSPLKVRRIEVSGRLPPGVYAKDLILHVIRVLGVNGGAGFAYEYGGEAISGLDMEERMTICNMSIEGGARIGYVNPDHVTFEYLRGRLYAPAASDWDRAVSYWKSVASDPDARYDDVVHFDASDMTPTVTWGVNPGQSIGIKEHVPRPEDASSPAQRSAINEAIDYMQLEPGTPIEGLPVRVAFIGSCTNGRLSDFREVARLVRGRKVAPGVRALAVPGSMEVARAAEREGLDAILREAGFEWRKPGCSMCLGMNPDQLTGSELCASSSNRNFKGRQGSPRGRTVLMSPVMVAAAALKGAITDARELFDLRSEGS